MKTSDPIKSGGERCIGAKLQSLAAIKKRRNALLAMTTTFFGDWLEVEQAQAWA